MSMLRRLRLVAALLLCAALTACGAFPRDPDHTLERIDREHVVRVGVSNAPPLTDTTSGTPKGREIDLVSAWAASRGAKPVWVLGGEEQLMTQLEEGRIDLVVGGLTKQTPWSSKAAITRPWGKAPDPVGEDQDYVVAAPLGENALVGSLERFFDEQGAR